MNSWGLERHFSCLRAFYQNFLPIFYPEECIQLIVGTLPYLGFSERAFSFSRWTLGCEPGSLDKASQFSWSKCCFCLGWSGRQTQEYTFSNAHVWGGASKGSCSKRFHWRLPQVLGLAFLGNCIQCYNSCCYCFSGLATNSILSVSSLQKNDWFAWRENQ